MAEDGYGCGLGEELFLLGLGGPSEGTAGMDDRTHCAFSYSFAVVWWCFHLWALVGNFAILWMPQWTLSSSKRVVALVSSQTDLILPKGS